MADDDLVDSILAYAHRLGRARKRKLAAEARKAAGEVEQGSTRKGKERYARVRARAKRAATAPSPSGVPPPPPPPPPPVPMSELRKE